MKEDDILRHQTDAELIAEYARLEQAWRAMVESHFPDTVLRMARPVLQDAIGAIYRELARRGYITLYPYGGPGVRWTRHQNHPR